MITPFETYIMFQLDSIIDSARFTIVMGLCLFSCCAVWYYSDDFKDTKHAAKRWLMFSIIIVLLDMLILTFCPTTKSARSIIYQSEQEGKK